MSQVLDLSVTIERVRVRTRVLGDRPPLPAFVAGHLGASPAAPPHDHRIVIRELRIDLEADLDASRARSLGAQVAAELGERLAELQDRRLLRLTDESATAPPIHVEALDLHLRGEIARHSPRQISMALLNAFTERARDAD